MGKGWECKRSISDKITTNEIDSIYSAGIKAGAIGGKILGAGGGGFIVFYARQEFQNAIRKKLKHLVYVPFKFETSGSCTVLNQPNALFPLIFKVEDFIPASSPILSSIHSNLKPLESAQR